jgi:pimeloyl-ACP methyl ester carboxylesterase
MVLLKIRRTAATVGLIALSLLLPLSQQAFGQSGGPTKVMVGDVELHYIEQGQGEVVILLHGGQGDYRAWPSLIEALAPRYHVISYSRRYHWPNANPLTVTNHSALVDADDLAGLIAALRLGAVHLVGTSYGAFTALALAIKQPELVRSMVVAEPPVHQWVTGTRRGATLYQERVATGKCLRYNACFSLLRTAHALRHAGVLPREDGGWRSYLNRRKTGLSHRTLQLRLLHPLRLIPHNDMLLRHLRFHLANAGDGTQGSADLLGATLAHHVRDRELHLG